MKHEDYIKNVLILEARDMTVLEKRFSEVSNIRLMHGVIGLASELGEIREMAMVDNEDEIDIVNLKEEMGDLYWYMGVMIDQLGLDPSGVFAHDDIAKIFEPAMIDKMTDAQKKENLNFVVDDMTTIVGVSADILKKTLLYGKELDVSGLAYQLFTLDYAISSALSLYGITPDQARERNIEKLRTRFGEKFTEAAALNRNLENERKVLEIKTSQPITD